jgi:hypothetical protein
MVNAECITIRSEIHKLINSVRNKEELPEEWKESVIVPICKSGDKTDCSQIRTKFYTSSCSHIYLHMQRKLLWIIIEDFDAADQLLIVSCIRQKSEKKNGNIMKQQISFFETSRNLFLG